MQPGPIQPGPTQWALFVHGILGTRANWRSIARSWVNAQTTGPGTSPARRAAVLVDLRLHGESQFQPPPHTLQAAAQDIVDLLPRLQHELGGPPLAILGHSFGGKVVTLATHRVATSTQAGQLCPKQLWIVDSALSANPNPEGASRDEANSATNVSNTSRILRDLTQLTPTFARRDDAVTQLVQMGHSTEIARWLAMNVRRDRAQEGQPFRLQLDVQGISSLLDDYFRTDLTDAMQELTQACQCHLLWGGLSNTVSLLEKQALGSMGATHTHTIENAGHWVHVDAPAELGALIQQHWQ